MTTIMQCSIMAKLALFLSILSLSWASYATPAAPNTTQVDVGIYLKNIPSVNLREKVFQVDFIIWFRWKGDQVNPIESFQIFNGTIDGKDGLVTKRIGDFNYASQRVQAKIYRKFDVDRYPLDNHVLKIQIEDNGSDAKALVYRVDKANSNVSPKITIPGWVVGKFEGYDSATTYKTNYGDISRGENAQVQFPRFTFAIELNREGYGYFFKYFFILFLAASVTFIAYQLSAELIDTRFFLVTASFFLAVITESSLSSTLPESDSFGMGTTIYLLTQCYIFLSTLGMILHFRQYATDPERAERASTRLGYGLTATYALLVVYVVFG